MTTINIDFYRDSSRAVNDAYDRLIAKIPLLKQKLGYRMFTVTGCEPGVGATTIAISLAVSLAGSGWKTLLLDADIRKGPAGKRLSSAGQAGLSELLKGEAEPPSAICKTNIEHLHYLPCGGETENPIVLFNSENMSKLMRMLSDQYDYVILDSPSLNTTVDAAVIASKTSGAILVAEHMHTKKSIIEVAMREMEQTGAAVIGIVLNRVSKKDYRRYIENYDYFLKAKTTHDSK
jgi:capsular exopolysaccharide synthesis family protein